VNHEIFIFSDRHDEHGSEFLSAHTTESSLIAVIEAAQSDIPEKDRVPVSELLGAAREANGESLTYIDHRGWGGASIFILSGVAK
jgi:hypothetical protein